MRLLRITEGEVHFDSFLNGTWAPPYAILSHRWEAEEITFQELQKSTLRLGTEARRRSWSKITESRRVARELGYNYVWVDSCCIDQKSSAELSEAINSMYAWYEQSAECIAYLSDDDGSDKGFRRSQWWKRGWTLQELIAPKRLTFYTGDWLSRVDRYHAAPEIEALTGIDSHILQAPNMTELNHVCAAVKFRWAAGRRTTRSEDQAYSLLCLFDVNLEPIYGEGLTNALWRLQVEVYRCTQDHSIFAWDLPKYTSKALFRRSP